MKHRLKIFLTVTSLLMYIGTAHGMIFLMDIGSLGNKESSKSMMHHELMNHDKMIEQMPSHMTHMSHESSHDMQSCIDHCVASMVFITSTFSIDTYLRQKDRIDTASVILHSLPTEIDSPPPKYSVV